jgi:transcriptional regulator with XRE-family HTH domain
MSNQSKSNLPYKILGSRLKRIRQRHSESVTEVSGAVEIDESLLARIEAGLERPAEDILELLINHFDMKDSDAMSLWSMAGYELESLYSDDATEPDQGVGMQKSVIMLLALESRTMYTDALDIHYDTNGLLLNFKQVVGQPQPISVAKLGMSYEQAEQVLKTLQRVLLHAKYLKGPKALPEQTKRISKHETNS